MKIRQITFALLTSIVLLSSCSNDSENLEMGESFSNLVYQETHLNTYENRNNIIEAIPSIEEDYNEDYDLNTANFDELIEDYQNCSDCPDEYKEFMAPFLYEIVETRDSDILSVIQEYKLSLASYEADYITKENLSFIFFSLEEVVKYQDSDGFVEMSTGSNIGKGMAWGFLSGCATGAYIGGTVGTVTVPIIGTVVGAVSGCIAAGAWGAVTGAAGGAFWSIFD